MHHRVAVCVRPRATEKGNNSIEIDDKENIIEFIEDSSSNLKTSYTFDKVVPLGCSQEYLYNTVARDIVQSAFNGYNGTIMAYGQTGAGKTFTMNGKNNTYIERGICQRSISELFTLKKSVDMSITIRVSYLEIYNEQVYDLLDFSEGIEQKQLLIHENQDGETIIRGLLKPVVENEDAASELFFRGQTNRTIAEHCLNKSSTRSHCIFTLYIEKRPLEEDSTSSIIYSKLHFVDLAGSERIKKTNTTGIMFKETTHINKSLTFLEQVVIALTDKNRQHIPYRQTTLTNILKDSLGGNCRTQLVACIWIDQAHNDQTLSSLKFASRMMRVKTKAILNITQDQSALATKYLSEINMLKKELALHDIISGREKCIEYINISPEYHKQLENHVMSYIEDSNKVIPFTTYNSILDIFGIFREHILKLRKQYINKNNSIAQNDLAINAGNFYRKDEERRSDKTIEEKSVLKPKEFHVSETINSIMIERFKEANEGMDVINEYENAKLNLKSAKQKTKNAANAVNIAKAELDALLKSSEELNPEIELQNTTNANNENTICHQKEIMLTNIRQIKKKYRTLFQEYEDAKKEMQYMVQAKEQYLKAFIYAFNEWKRQHMIS